MNDPLDNLFRLYRLVDEKITANMLPSISEAAEYQRSTFLKFGRMFLSDGSLAGLLTSACDAFAKTKPPRRQRAVSLLRSTGDSLREHLVQTYTVENRKLVNYALEELKNQVSSNAGSGSNAVIASRAHAYFRNKYPYTRVRDFSELLVMFTVAGCWFAEYCSTGICSNHASKFIYATWLEQLIRFVIWEIVYFKYLYECWPARVSVFSCTLHVLNSTCRVHENKEYSPVY